MRKWPGEKQETEYIRGAEDDDKGDGEGVGFGGAACSYWTDPAGELKKERGERTVTAPVKENGDRGGGGTEDQRVERQ